MLNKKQTKTSISKYVEITYNLDKTKADEVVGGIFSLIQKSLEQGKSVQILNVGLLYMANKKEQKISNFGKGVKTIPKRVKLKFKASRNFGVSAKTSKLLRDLAK